jgi:hypothetical protein
MDRRPRWWLLVIRRVYAIGALAVRLEDWEAVRTLALQRPRSLRESTFPFQRGV